MVKENLLKLNSCEHIIVNNSVASIYSHPSFSSELVTQALFWEKLIIQDNKDNWYKVKQGDNYEGWIHSFYVIDSYIYDNNKFLQNQKNWYWVRKRFLNLSKNNKSDFLISYGSLIPCFEDNNQFVTMFPDGRKIPIDKKILIQFSDNINYKNNVLNALKELKGIPYLWGGKSSFGFDCSGLLQTILNVSNVKYFPRDTTQQILSNILIKKQNKANIGDIIFFKTGANIDHVGLYINDKDFMHSSGSVKINSINKESPYYSNKLELNLYGIYEVNIKC